MQQTNGFTDNQTTHRNFVENLTQQDEDLLKEATQRLLNGKSLDDLIERENVAKCKKKKT